MNFRQLSVSQSWFLVSAAFAQPKKLRAMKWREHSPSTSACGQGSGAGVDALIICRLSLLFPGSLSGLPIAPLKKKHFDLILTNTWKRFLDAGFTCVLKLPEADTANGKILSVFYMPSIKYRVFCDGRYCIAWRKDGRFFLRMVFFFLVNSFSVNGQSYQLRMRRPYPL